MKYPLLFSFREPILGNGFIAGVEMKGAALVVDEDGAFWAYGVHPGAIAAQGADLESAYRELREGVRRVLSDFAVGARTLKDFSAEVERFFHAVDDETKAEFENAREDVRAGKVASALPRITQPTIEVSVVRLRKPEPKDNATERPMAFAA